MAATALLDKLAEARLEYELLPHRWTGSASSEAHALGVSEAETAKTLVVRIPDGNVRAVLPASRRLDLGKLRDALGVDQTTLLTEGELAREYPEFELGAVPPVGGREDRVVLDRQLADATRVILEAGTHEESLRMLVSDLIAVAHAEVVDISRD